MEWVLAAWSSHLGQPLAPALGWPGFAAQVLPRGEVCGKFCSCFPARASWGVVTQRLGLQAGTEKRGKARRGEIRKPGEKERTPGVLLDRADPPPPSLPPDAFSAAWSPAPTPPPLPLPRCPLPFPSAPPTLLPSSALLPPPSLRPACLFPPPPREASLRPNPEEDASPSATSVIARAATAHRPLRPRSRVH